MSRQASQPAGGAPAWPRFQLPPPGLCPTLSQQQTSEPNKPFPLPNRFGHGIYHSSREQTRTFHDAHRFSPSATVLGIDPGLSCVPGGCPTTEPRFLKTRILCVCVCLCDSECSARVSERVYGCQRTICRSRFSFCCMGPGWSEGEGFP